MKKPKFFKNVSWLEPYLESVSDIIPTYRITSVRGYRVAMYKTELLDGSITEHYNGNININILIQKQDYATATYKNIRIANILDTFAHELAHLIEWDHTPDHLYQQAKILLCFAKVSKKLNVKDLSLRHKTVKD